MKFPWYIWIPRILMIVAILFMGMFSADVFGGHASIWQKLLGFLMHNILPPTIPMAIVLWLTWKRPLWGGIIFTVLAVAFGIWIAIYFKRFILFDLLAFSLPMLISALLFFLAHANSIKNKEKPAPKQSPEADTAA